MATKNYYEILGVEKTATQEDIAKAYKKLCLKSHPDRWVSGTDAEKKEAEEKFKEINEANTILSNEEKRRNYDTFGSADGSVGGGGFDPFSGFNPFGGFNPFSQHGFDFGFGRDDIKKGEDIHITTTISMEESFVGGSKTVTYHASKPCTHCNGTGAKDGKFEPCPHCGGKGTITQVKQTPMGTQILQSTCPRCHGTGAKDGNFEKCPECHGTGSVNEIGTKTIRIPAGVFNGATVVFSGQGEVSRKGGPNGDLLVTFAVLPNDKFRREEHNIITSLKLKLNEAWEGCEKTINNIDGSAVKVKIDALTPVGKVYTFKGKGFINPQNPYIKGDLKVSIDYEVPTKKLTKDQKKLLDEFYDLEKKK